MRHGRHNSPMGRAVLALPALLLAACGTLQAYDGERLPRQDRAVVRADPAFSAGLPVQVILRKADELAVPATRASVEFMPGLHQLIVDCRVAAAGTTTRFAIEVEVETGRAYRLVAEANAQRCEAVRLEAT